MPVYRDFLVLKNTKLYDMTSTWHQYNIEAVCGAANTNKAGMARVEVKPSDI